MNKSSGSSPDLSNAKPSPFMYEQQRIKFLLTILRGASAIGLLLVISYLGHSTPTLGAIVVGAYLLLLITTFVPLAYPLRASILLAICYLLGVSALFEAGIYGDSRLWFLTFSLLAAMLFDRREYFITIGLSVVTIGIMEWLLTSGTFTLSSPEIQVGSLSTWIVETLMLILIATVFEEGWRRLRREFNVSQATLQNAMSALSDERTHLEERVAERTAELKTASLLAQDHAERLHAISELAHTIAFIQDPDELLPSVARLISEHFGFYHVGVFLTDENGEFIVLRAANSPGGQRMIAAGYRLKVGQAGIVSLVASTGEPKISVNVKDDPMYYGHPDLPKTHSEMALPLVVGQRIIGVLDLQSTTESAFDEQDLEIMRTLADQVSIAIENARLFSETRHALSEARAVYGQYMRQSWEQLPDERSAYGYRYSGMKADPLHAPLDLSEIQAATQTGQMVAPTSKSPNIAVPLKLREEVIGVLDIRSANPSRQWSDNEIAVVQAVAERVALALENARLFEETTRRADRERTVSEITTRIRSTNDPQLMLKTALDELKRVLGADDILVRPYAAQSVQKQPSAKRIKPSQPVKQDKVSR